MGERRRIALLIFLLWLVSECSGANEPGRFAISQVSAQPPTVTVYLDVLDENGQPPASLLPSELSAAIQGQPLTVSQVTSFDASGEGVAYLFLVDVSKSIGPAQFAQIRQAIDTWIEGLKSADQMALFTFGEEYKQVVPFTDDKAKLKSVLQDLKPTDMQTKLYLALNDAMNMSRETTAGLPNRRAIVILSDGKDEGSGITAEDVRDLIQQSRVPIYAIGYSRLPVQERETYLEVLNRFATLSGGLYTATASVNTAYEEMQAAIRRVFVVRLNCAGCRTESQLRPLEMTLTSGVTARTSSLNVNLIAPRKPQPWWEPVLEWASKWKIVLSLGVVVIIAVGVTFRVVFGKRPRTTSVAQASVHSLVVPHSGTKPAASSTPAPSSASIPKGQRIQMTVVAGKEHGRVDYINLVSKSVIGRDRGCDVSFPDDTEMSGKHFELRREGSYIEVADLGSTNGTLFNGAQLVTSHRLADGDLVRAGRTEMRINFGGET